MPTIRIQLQTKNHSVITTLKFSSDYVPRAGELLDLSHILEYQEIPTFIVTSVVGLVTKDEGIIPHIVARQWMKGLRAELLEEYGWLPQSADTDICYDEDQLFHD